MDYGNTLERYVEILADKYYSGKITEERFLELTDKLIAWEVVAVTRGVL